ncbi:MAG: hypothetical protein J5742_03755, partial [Alphaproteobacteria bacterium]|nr:hypothetical protein [Alphaproteobacteria bacterium]
MVTLVCSKERSTGVQINRFYTAGLFSHISRAGENMFRETFYGCTNLQSYIPPDLFEGFIDNDDDETNFMTNIFTNSGLDESCPIGMVQYTPSLSSYWTPKVSCVDGPPFTITLNPSPGSGGTTTIYEKYDQGWSLTTSDFSSALTITKPTPQAGYSFAGYQDSNNNLIIDADGDVVATPTTFTANATLTAMYTPNTYTVTYACGTGATGDAPANGTATYNAAFNAAANTCSKTGYTFAGWLPDGASSNWVNGTTW